MKRPAQNYPLGSSTPKLTKRTARSAERTASTFIGWHDAANYLGNMTSQVASGSTEPIYNLRRRREANPRAFAALPQSAHATRKAKAPPRPRKEVPDDDVPPRPRHSAKRPTSPDPEERSSKCRRTSDDAVTGSSRQQSRRVRQAVRAANELKKMRHEASVVHKLLTKTETAIARATEGVQNLMQGVETLDARRVSSSQDRSTRQWSGVQTHPTLVNDNVTSLAEPASSVTGTDLQTVLAALKQARANGSGKRAADDTLRPVLDALIDADPLENKSCCTCRPTSNQRSRIQETAFTRPRPRIGADAQGFQFHDMSDAWSTPEFHPGRLMRKERDVQDMLAHRHEDAFVDNLPGLPVPLRPRTPRVFKQQFTVQFQHLPASVLVDLERWHIGSGRCGNCILRAMRTFPPWIIDVVLPAAKEDGCPVYENRAEDEMAEWDEERRQWRYLVLDHYRWIPAEELEERPSDSTADPKIVNGTGRASVPWTALIDYDALNE